VSREEKEFVANGEVSEPDLATLLERLAELSTCPDEARQEAIVCLLSGSEGWREAADRLSGAFAAARLGRPGPAHAHEIEQ
jgi:hypothetical protein